MITIRQKPHGLVLILFSAVISIPVISLMELMHYTMDWLAVQVRLVLNTLAFILFIGPITGLFLFHIQRKQLHPLRRTLIVILPALVFFIMQIGSSLATHPKKRFAKMMDCEVPEHSTDFKASRFGGGFDELDMYHFRTTPAGIARLLASRGYSYDENQSSFMTDTEFQNDLPVGGVSTPKGWPKPRDWPGLRIYSFKEENWFYYIMVDGNKSEVFAIAGST